jgi:hypothetical protein
VSPRTADEEIGAKPTLKLEAPDFSKEKLAQKSPPNQGSYTILNRRHTLSTEVREKDEFHKRGNSTEAEINRQRNFNCLSRSICLNIFI